MRNSLRWLEGIHSVEVDIELEEAIVLYSPTLVSVKEMTKATTDIGFPSFRRPDNAPGESQDSDN